jgi:tetratricopeptide (TPR) repeat protein
LDEAEANIRHTPGDAQPWAQLGALLLAHAFPHEAQQCFQAAGELDRTNWQWPYFQAVAQKYESAEDAVRSLQEALARSPEAEAARLLHAELLTNLGRHQEAEAQFRHVLQTAPNHARARLGLSRVLLARGEYERALEALQPSLTHRSTRRAAQECRAQIEQRLGRLDSAAQALAEMRKLPPDAPWPDEPEREFELLRTDRLGYVANALSFQKAGKLKEAHEIARVAESRYPELYFLVEGNMRLERGDAVGAEAALRQSVQLKPDWVESQFSLGRALALQGKNSEAEQAFRKVIAIEPSYGPAYFELGRCMTQINPAQARAALQSAVDFMPQSAAAHEELAAVLQRENQAVEAERHLQIAKQLRSK